MSAPWLTAAVATLAMLISILNAIHTVWWKRAERRSNVERVVSLVQLLDSALDLQPHQERLLAHQLRAWLRPQEIAALKKRQEQRWRDILEPS